MCIVTSLLDLIASSFGGAPEIRISLLVPAPAAQPSFIQPTATGKTSCNCIAFRTWSFSIIYLSNLNLVYSQRQQRNH